MYNDNQYYQNRINEQQQVSVESTVMPDFSEPEEYRQGSAFFYGPYRGHGLIDRWLKLPGTTRFSAVFASITELGDIDGTHVLKPFQGSASMEILNVVPQDDGTIRVRVNILWDNDLWYRISAVRFGG
ncbi:hypothetical protein V7183_07825 [Bacillus sp. JJ1127]|uniref:hypothetical protein n=1 Tax=Bacillus sp. JJ1127 TaxID=3122952 RepID=UPI002FFF7884